MKGEEGEAEQIASLNTLFDVLLNTTILMSCITPFISDYIYMNLKNGVSSDNTDYFAESIHFLRIPNYKDSLLNENVERMVSLMQNVILLGRKIRDNKKISLKTPLNKVVVIDSDPEVQRLLLLSQQYIKEELNCLELEFQTNEEEFIVYKSEPDNKACGSAFGKLYATLKPVL